MINIRINGFWDVTPCSVVKDPNILEKLAVSLRTNVVYIQVLKLMTESLGARGSRMRSTRANICYQMSEISCLDLKQLWFSHPALSKVHWIHKGSRLTHQVELHKIPNSKKSNVRYQFCWNTDLEKSMLDSACTQTWFAGIHYNLLLAIKKLNFEVLNYTSLGFMACT